MKSSARNQFAGTIRHIEESPHLWRIEVECGMRTVYAHISTASAAALRPFVGQTAVVMVKAPSVIVVTDPLPFRLSAENQMTCTVRKVEKGAVNNVVALEDEYGHSLAAAITLHSSEYLDLHEGQEVLAMFNADQTTLAVL